MKRESPCFSCGECQGSTCSLLEWLEDFDDPVAEVLRKEVGTFAKDGE